ncbi:hypothetical protein CR513_30108, partial [Mucuna pruriens]
MTVALRSKKKFQFDDETLLKPLPDDPNLVVWDHCNTLLVFVSIIMQRVLWMESVDANNIIRGIFFALTNYRKRFIRLSKENCLSHITQIKGLWKELNNFMPILACTYQIGCSCNLVPLIKSYREIDYVTHFLKGLNEQYAYRQIGIPLKYL